MFFSIYKNIQKNKIKKKKKKYNEKEEIKTKKKNYIIHIFLYMFIYIFILIYIIKILNRIKKKKKVVEEMKKCFCIYQVSSHAASVSLPIVEFDKKNLYNHKDIIKMYSRSSSQYWKKEKKK